MICFDGNTNETLIFVSSDFLFVFFRQKLKSCKGKKKKEKLSAGPSSSTIMMSA